MPENGFETKASHELTQFKKICECVFSFADRNAAEELYVIAVDGRT